MDRRTRNYYHLNRLFFMFLLLFLFVLSVTLCSEMEQADVEWLKREDDIQLLADV